MKAKKNPNEAWEHLEKQWSSKLSNEEDELPVALFDRVQERLEGEKKKGGFINFMNVKWVAAASIILLLGFLWIQRKDQIESTSKEIVHVTPKKSIRIENEFSSVKAESEETKSLLGEKVKVVKRKIEGVQRKEEFKMEEQMIAKSTPEEPLREIQIDVVKMPERKEERKVEVVAVKQELPAEEMFVIVDVEPVKKEKGIKKVLGFLQKVKTGKVFDALNRNREGKLNDEIHQVVYKYQEKEEKIKTMLSL